MLCSRFYYFVVTKQMNHNKYYITSCISCNRAYINNLFFKKNYQKLKKLSKKISQPFQFPIKKISKIVY